MTLRIGINGFGRVGRNVLRAAYLQQNLEVAAIADAADPEVLTYLLNFDSLNRKFPEKVTLKDGNLHLRGKDIPFINKEAPGDVDWKEHGVQVVIDATEVHRHREILDKHLHAGAQRVVITVPPAEEYIPFSTPGVGGNPMPDEKIVSCGSATAHCLVPIVHILHQAFGIDKGFMTVVRAFTSEQNLMDSPNPHDLRLSRAAAENIIPSRTWSYRALGRAIPELAERFDGISMEVPVPNGSTVDLVTILKQDVTVDQINQAVKKASQGELQGIVEYCEDPIVSSDVIGNHHSAIFDSLTTSVNGGNMVKTITWYDNDWAFAHRLLDLAQQMVRG